MLIDVYSLYRGIYFTFALLGCVRYNEDFVESRLTVFHTRGRGGGGEGVSKEICGTVRLPV